MIAADAGDTLLPLAPRSGLVAAALFAGGALRARAAHLARRRCAGRGRSALLGAPRRAPRLACACCRSRARRLVRRSRSGGRRCPTARGTTRTARSSTCSSPRSACGSPIARASSRSGSRPCSPRCRLVAPREGAAASRRLRPAPGVGPPARPGRPLEPARPARRLRAAARALDRRPPSRARCSPSRGIVALLLTYSRGGLAVGGARRRRLVPLGDERLDALGALVAAGCPRRPSSGSRSRCRASRATARACTRAATTGSSSASCSSAGAVATRPARGAGRLPARCSRRALVVAGGPSSRAAVGASWAAAHELAEVGNGAGRIAPRARTSAGSGGSRPGRLAAHGLEGTGAGSFPLTNLLYRRSSVDTTTEPHDLPIQFLSETGIVGAARSSPRPWRSLRPVWRDRAGPSSRWR